MGSDPYAFRTQWGQTLCAPNLMLKRYGRRSIAASNHECFASDLQNCEENCENEKRNDYPLPNKLKG